MPPETPDYNDQCPSPEVLRLSLVLKACIERELHKHSAFSAHDVALILASCLQEIFTENPTAQLLVDSLTYEVDNYGICTIAGHVICEIATQPPHMEAIEVWVARWHEPGILQLISHFASGDKT